MTSSIKSLLSNYSLIFIAACLFLYVSVVGSFDLSIIEIKDRFTFYLKFDALSSVLFLMIVILGTSIYQYSKRYLAGEKSKVFFLRNLIFVLVFVSLYVLSSNLWSLFLFWKLTSFGLNKLLVFYHARKGAIQAARKKMLVSSIGDITLLIGIFLTYLTFGTGDLHELFEILKNKEILYQNSSILHIISLTFVIGAMIKSAQFPFHFWLPETMETPTPVSALMHAGIINAGGFFIIRMNPLIGFSPAAQSILIIGGAFTAVFASLVMITQNDIKKKLAYSTISQMGLMMVGCGLSLYGVVLFHIIAHSLYKSQAFLSTGSLVQEKNKKGFKLEPLSIKSLLICSVSGFAVLAGGYFLYEGNYYRHSVYLSILLLGLMQNTGSFTIPISKKRVYLKCALILLIAMLVYLTIEFILGSLVGNVIKVESSMHISWSDPVFVSTIILYALFVLGLWVAPGVMRPKGNRSKFLYLFLFNGCYFSALSSRILKRTNMLSMSIYRDQK